MRAPDIAEQVAASTAASMVPLRLEDPTAAKLIAEALKPHVKRPALIRQVAA